MSESAGGHALSDTFLLDFAVLAVQADPIARVLGPAWQSMGYGTVSDRASQLEPEARFARTLTHYMADTDSETAGEALERLMTVSAYRPGELFSRV